MTNLLRNSVIAAVILVSTLAADVWGRPTDQYWHVEQAAATTNTPVFKRKPGDQLAATGDDVTMTCSLLEEEDLTVNWRRGDGRPLPQGRYKIREDRSLFLSDIQSSDQAVYVCSASNKFGTSEASAKLTVHSAPRFLSKPRDKFAIVGKHIKLRCSVAGNPQPSMFWSKNEFLIFENQKMGRFSVDAEGNLRIQDSRTDDSGDWVCNALSTAGSISATANLKVIHSDPTRTCKDWRGRTVYGGERFYPDEHNPCHRCRCLNSTASHCKTRTCHHQPTEPCAIWQKVPQECCRFTCIKRHTEKGATYLTGPTPQGEEQQPVDDDNGTNAVHCNILATVLTLILAKLVT